MPTLSLVRLVTPEQARLPLSGGDYPDRQAAAQRRRNDRHVRPGAPEVDVTRAGALTLAKLPRRRKSAWRS